MSGSSCLRLRVLSALRRGDVTKTKFGFSNKIQQRSASTMSHVVDLRSDTVTKPTPAMKQAMMDAALGDDVMGEDPTVNELQRVFAKRLGKEAALFVPTCTMANTIAVLVHCEGRFSEVILGNQSHLHFYEVGAAAQLGGVHGKLVDNLPNGTMALQDMEDSIRVTDDVHQPWTKLICLENTHNRCGGKVISLDYMNSVRQLADRYDVKFHLDGARIFNAAVALGVPVSEVAASAHSVSVAFSKGLCCPLGSMLVGSQDFIYRARRARKALGGGMRQAGVIAAPPLLALDTMVDRLKDDHSRARRIAQAVDSMVGNPVCRVDMEGVHTNIVMIEMIGHVSPANFSARMAEVTDLEKQYLGEAIRVLMLPFGKTITRYVTHYDIDDNHVEKVVKKIKYVIEDLSKQS